MQLAYHHLQPFDIFAPIILHSVEPIPQPSVRSLDASGLSGRHAQRAMRFAEVEICEIERNRSLKVFLLLLKAFVRRVSRQCMRNV